MPKKTDKPKQDDIPGIEGPGVSRPKFPVIDKAARVWISLKTERCAFLEKEKAAKKIVIDKIKEHGEEIGVDSNGEIVYRYDDQLLCVKPGKDVLVVKELDSE